MPDPEQFQPLVFPSSGLDVSESFQNQRPLTTASATNVRLFENLTQRSRGGSRSGLSQYIPDQLPAPIQNIDSVVWFNQGALGSANYQAGDPSWTTLTVAGTYLLGRLPASPWAMSQVLGLDVNGNWSSTPLPGTPVGGDVLTDPSTLLATPIDLPTNYYVLAYWQPGAFPLDTTGDFQNSDTFPGFGWMADHFTGSVNPDFGYPTATTLGFDVTSPATPPTGQFWNWPSGYLDINIEFTFPRQQGVVFWVVVTGFSINIPDTISVSLSINNIVVLATTFSTMSFSPSVLSYGPDANGYAYNAGVELSGQSRIFPYVVNDLRPPIVSYSTIPTVENLPYTATWVPWPPQLAKPGTFSNQGCTVSFTANLLTFNPNPAFEHAIDAFVFPFAQHILPSETEWTPFAVTETGSTVEYTYSLDSFGRQIQTGVTKTVSWTI